MDPDNDFVTVSPARDHEPASDLPLRPAPPASKESENPIIICPAVNESTLADIMEPEYEGIGPAEWNTLSSLLPLFQLLPALKEESGYYTICGPVTDADISKFRAQSKLVHVLSIAGSLPSPSLGSNTHASRCSTPVIERSQSPQPPPAPGRWGFGGPPAEPLLPQVVPAPLNSEYASQKEAEVAASVYVRLMQHCQDCLLPSLTCLRLNMKTVSTTQLQYVYPLLAGTSTLRELELDDIQADLQHVNIPLLSSLPYQAPALETLVLRGFPQSSFSSSFLGSVITMLTELRRLELHNVLEEVTPEFLQTIGSLPALTTLVIRDGKAEAPAFDDGIVEAGRKEFKALRNIDITASFKLILGFLRRVGSTMVESITFSPVVDETYDGNDARDVEALKRQVQESRRAQAEAEAMAARIAAEEARVKAEEARAKAEKARLGFLEIETKTLEFTECVPPEDMWGRGWGRSEPPVDTTPCYPPCLSPSPCPTPRTPRAWPLGSPPPWPAGFLPQRSPPPPPPPLLISWAATIADILTLLCTQWPSLRDLNINLVDTSDASRIFELPSQYLDRLDALKDLGSFRLNNWKVDQQFEATIRALAPRLPQLKILRFPLGKFRSAVTLRTLQVIAESCPALEDLQVGVSLKDVGELDTGFLEKHRGNAHPLRVLSVGSDAAPPADNLEESRALMVTLIRTLDVLFPQLQDVITHPGEGSKFWEGIRDFLWVCQSVRGDERFRSPKPVTPGIAMPRTLFSTLSTSIPTPRKLTLIPRSTTMDPTPATSVSIASFNPRPSPTTLPLVPTPATSVSIAIPASLNASPTTLSLMPETMPGVGSGKKKKGKKYLK